MRQTIVIIAICLLGAVGCRHVGGKCDCGPMAGDPVNYAPNPPVPTAKPDMTGAPKPMPMPK